MPRTEHSGARRGKLRRPNPQGKGVVPVLRDWSALQAAVPEARTPLEFLRDYCVSSLVLSASFRFRPVIGKTYYLYAGESRWSLSLVAPQEWGPPRSGEFLARCRLRRDMTWELDFEDMTRNAVILARARRCIQGFVDSFAGQQSICDHLPLYVAHLPYYQRLLATALACSLQRSLPATGDSVQALLQALPEEHTALLGAGPGAHSGEPDSCQ